MDEPRSRWRSGWRAWQVWVFWTLVVLALISECSGKIVPGPIDPPLERVQQSGAPLSR